MRRVGLEKREEGHAQCYTGSKYCVSVTNLIHA